MFLFSFRGCVVRGEHVRRQLVRPGGRAEADPAALSRRAGPAPQVHRGHLAVGQRLLGLDLDRVTGDGEHDLGHRYSGTGTVISTSTTSVSRRTTRCQTRSGCTTEPTYCQ